MGGVFPFIPVFLLWEYEFLCMLFWLILTFTGTKLECKTRPSCFIYFVLQHYIKWISTGLVLLCFWEDGYFLKTLHFSVHSSGRVITLPFLFNYLESHKHTGEMYWTWHFCSIIPVRFYSKHSLLQEIFSELNSPSAHNISTMDTKFAQCMWNLTCHHHFL